MIESADLAAFSPGKRVKLFVSHASEDNEGFVRPLAVELRNYFDVWYDEFSLRLGDSLREKIDAGLRSCDFGVVVLSPAFFAKQWTIAELNGLFALEQINKKLVLPVWYNVGKADVVAFSPILADRLAAQASEGITQVVAKIRMAVGVSERSHQVLAPDLAQRAIDAMTKQLIGRELDEHVLRSEKGAALFLQSFDRIVRKVWGRFEASNSPERRRFTRRDRQDCAVIHGPDRASLCIGTRNVAANSVRAARLVATFYLRATRIEENEKVTHSNWIFRPTLVSEGKIGFHADPAGNIVSPEVILEDELSALIVQQLCSLVSDQLRKQHEDSWIHQVDDLELD